MTFPDSHELRSAPELAILAAAENALTIAIRTLAVVHPDLTHANSELQNYTVATEEAATIMRQATDLIARIQRYRNWVLDLDADPF
jgi:hypothetical protein